MDMILFTIKFISYSLGDAIDWKLKKGNTEHLLNIISYSLGDAIDWKQKSRIFNSLTITILLLARGRD